MMQIEDVFPINHPNLQLPKDTSEEVEAMTSYYDRVLGNKRSDKKKSNEKILYKETFIHGYVYVYDLSAPSTLDEIAKVIDYIHIREEKEAGKKKSGIAAKILVGAKKDAPTTLNAPASITVEQLKKKYNLLYRKVSALTNTEVNEAFLDLARNAMNRSAEHGGMNEDDDDHPSSGFFSFFGCGSRDIDPNQEQGGNQDNNSSRCIIF